MDNKILEELKRFKQIGHNSHNLDEQMIGNVANLGMGSHVERLLKKAAAMKEQEDVELDTEGDVEGDVELDVEGDVEGGDIPTDPDAEVDVDIDAEEIPAEEGGEEIGIDTEEAPAEDETELDVTELVTKQDEVNTELTDQKDILEKNTQSLEDLMNKLSDLESHLTSMDDMVSKISDLEDKLEEYRPRTPEEQISLRKHDSGPFNKTLSDFFVDKEEVFKKTGKKQYTLTADDVDNYQADDIKKSFDPNNEEE